MPDVIDQLTDSVNSGWRELRQQHTADSNGQCRQCRVTWPCRIALDATKHGDTWPR